MAASPRRGLSFWIASRRGWAVISCGIRNRYGHPRMEVLEELQAAGVRTFSTDINGATCFRLNGKSVVPEADCGWEQYP